VGVWRRGPARGACWGTCTRWTSTPSCGRRWKRSEHAGTQPKHSPSRGQADPSCSCKPWLVMCTPVQLQLLCCATCHRARPLLIRWCVVQGDVPVPRSDHCATVYNERYSTLFGVARRSFCFNDIHVLDLRNSESMASPWPSSAPARGADAAWSHLCAFLDWVSDGACLVLLSSGAAEEWSEASALRRCPRRGRGTPGWRWAAAGS